MRARGHVLSTEMGMKLCEPVTDEEVRNAIFSIDINKSPGPDGFVKAAWQIVGGDICKATTARKFS